MFGRYVGSPVSMHSGNSSDTDYSYGYTEEQLAELRKRGLLDKNSDMYKAKRERNNIAVCRGIQLLRLEAKQHHFVTKNSIIRSVQKLYLLTNKPKSCVRNSAINFQLMIVRNP